MPEATNKKFLLVRTEGTRQVKRNRRKLLEGKGRISHKQAVEKAEKEFEIYRAREMRQLESDFDRAVKLLQQQYENNKKG